MSKSTTVNSPCYDSTEVDKSLKLLFAHLKGQVVSVRTQKEPNIVYSGIVTNSEMYHEGFCITLEMYYEKGDVLSVPNEGKWELSSKDLLEISVSPLLISQKKDISSNSFKTDEEISNASLRHRELQPWQDETFNEVDDELLEEDLDGNDDGGEILGGESDKMEGNSKRKKGKRKGRKGKGKTGSSTPEWNQFDANWPDDSKFEQEYETAYTTVLDKESTFYKERVQHATKIAADIENAFTRNPHLREERGQGIADDEEALFSSVKRDAGESDSGKINPVGSSGIARGSLGNSSGSNGGGNAYLQKTSSGDVPALNRSGSGGGGTPTVPSKHVIPPRRNQEKSLRNSHGGSPKIEPKSVSALGLEPPKVSDKVVTEFLQFNNNEESKAKKGKLEEIEQLRRFSEGYDRRMSTGSPKTARKVTPAVTTENNTSNIPNAGTTGVNSNSSTSSISSTTTSTQNTASTTAPGTTNISGATTVGTTTSAPTNSLSTTATTASTTTKPGLSLPKSSLNPFAKEFKPGSSTFTPKLVTPPLSASGLQQPNLVQSQTIPPSLPITSLQSQPQPQILSTSPPQHPIPFPYMQYTQGQLTHVTTVPPPRGVGIPAVPGLPVGNIPAGTLPGGHVSAAPRTAPVHVQFPTPHLPGTSSVGPTPPVVQPAQAINIPEMYNRVQKQNDSLPIKRKTINWGSSSSSLPVISGTPASTSGNSPGSSPNVPSASTPPTSWLNYVPKPILPHPIPVGILPTPLPTPSPFPTAPTGFSPFIPPSTAPVPLPATPPNLSASLASGPGIPTTPRRGTSQGNGGFGANTAVMPANGGGPFSYAQNSIQAMPFQPRQTATQVPSASFSVQSVPAVNSSQIPSTAPAPSGSVVATTIQRSGNGERGNGRGNGRGGKKKT